MEETSVSYSFDHNQLGLFTMTWPEVIKSYGCTSHQAAVLFHQGYLSFDPTPLRELQQSQARELDFLKKLVFDSGLPRSYVEAMLSQLHRPFCYSLNAIYWDFADNRWKEFTDYLDRFRSGSLKYGFLLELDDVLEECDLAELRRVKEALESAIERKEEEEA